MAKQLSLDREVDVGEQIPVDKSSAEYACFMDIQKFNCERGFMSEEKYKQMQEGNLVSQRRGKRTYFFMADK